MTPFAYGERLTLVRTGRFADAATALAWAVGAAVTALHPAGLAVAGLLLGLVATSIARAVAAGASFGIVAAAAGVAWLAVIGSPPQIWGVEPAVAIALAVLVPPAVAASVRVLG